MEESFNRETTMLASHSGCRAKLIFNPMFLYNLKYARAEDAGENLRAHVHERDPSPLVWIGEVAFRDEYDLTFVPFGKVDFFTPVGVEKV